MYKPNCYVLTDPILGCGLVKGFHLRRHPIITVVRLPRNFPTISSPNHVTANIILLLDIH